MTLYFSHIRLNKSPSMQAIASLLIPEDKAARLSAQHKLLWSAFSDGADRKRDFLWREESDGSFLTLSERAPLESDIFLSHRVKDYAPQIQRGDCFEFSLRANATRAKPNGARVDVVMDALYSIDKCERADKRMTIANEEGGKWLIRQGARAGFDVVSSLVHDYRVEILPRPGKTHAAKAKFGIIDLSGVVKITDPDLFQVQMANGFGRAKSFGCGLMLIKRQS